MYETMGDDDVMGELLGYDDATVGAALRAARKPMGSRMLRLPPKAPWRQGQLAPGVHTPGQGLIPLPLVPDAGTGVPNVGIFSATVGTINFSARPQKPYHAERLLVTVRRTGAAATIILCTTMFVGTDLQTAEVGAFDVEQFGPTAFGVRLQLKPAEPGILIRLTCQAIPIPGGADLVNVAMQFLGRYIG